MIATTEYELLRENAGLVDRSARGKLRLTGTEAAEFLQGQVTNDVEALEPGEGCYATLLTHKGKVIADMRILRGEDFLLIDMEEVALPFVKRNVEMYSIGRDVKLVDETGSLAILSLIGPAARDALDTAPPADAPEHAWVQGEHGMYVATDTGIDVITSADGADVVRETIGIPEVNLEAAECVRVENGRPRHGIDFGSETIPQEAGLNERAVSFTKGCYVGQETVARLHYKGKPNRHLRGLRLSAPGKPGDEITLDGKVVGKLGTTVESPVHGHIALALVRREAPPGTAVLVGETGAEAVVADLPFD